MKSPLSIPLTFPAISGLRDSDDNKRHTLFNLLESGLSEARPTALAYWGHSLDDPSDQRDYSNGGAILGCEDGTLYVFHQSFPSADAIVKLPSPEVTQTPTIKSPRRVPRGSHVHSGSTSPSTTSFSGTPFNVASRSRVVSVVNTEQVEAPKNYVDFDDEPEKLKDMLKGRKPISSEYNSEKNGTRSRSSSSSVKEQSAAPTKRKDPPKSLLSATNSPIHTPKSFSPPASPRDQIAFSTDAPNHLRLRSHIIPAKSGPGRSITCVKFLDNERLFIVLQATGDLYVFSSGDGACIATADVANALLPDSGVNEKNLSIQDLVWCSLSISKINEEIFLLVSATNADALSLLQDNMSDGSYSIMFQLVLAHELNPYGVELLKINQWNLEGDPRNIGIHEESDHSHLVYAIDSEGHFVIRHLRSHNLYLMQSNSSESDHPHTSLQIPNPFKALRSRSTDHIPEEKEGPKITLDERQDVGIFLSGCRISGSTVRHVDGKLAGIAWTEEHVVVYHYQQAILTILTSFPSTGVEDASWLDNNRYSLIFEDRAEVYNLKVIDADNNDVDKKIAEIGSVQVNSELQLSLAIGPYDVLDFASSSELLVFSRSEIHQQRFMSIPLVSQNTTGPDRLQNILWQAKLQGRNEPPSPINLTSLLPLEIDVIVQGYADGYLRQFPLAQMSRKFDQIPLTGSSPKVSDRSLGGYITGLHLVLNSRTKEKYILGGADDGSIAFWTSSFSLCARWTVFNTRLDKVIEFSKEHTGPLRGCVLCIALDGTIAVVVVDGFHFMYLIPGSAAPLQRVCLGDHNLLLIYGDHRARLWDVQTKEFWRSMGLDKAEELLAQGGWTDLSVEDDYCIPKTVWTTIADSSCSSDAVSTLCLDLQRFVVDSVTVTKMISTNLDQTRTILQTLDRLRLILSTLLTPGLNEDVDSICYGKLGVYQSSVSVGFSSTAATTLFHNDRPSDAWCISGSVTASRAVSIILLLRAMSLFEELLEGSNTVISFYANSLGPCVGPSYQPPSLAFLARHWFESSFDVRQAIRVVFDATVACMTDDEAIKTAEQWQHHVPFLKPPAERETIDSALALCISGYVAAEKYSLLTTNALTDISKSISMYLQDENSIYRVLAIDLCSRGFHVWQHYIDAMEILRSLFNLATNVRKDSISVQNVGSQARSAVLSIASNNTPLFMTTLCLDILTPPSLDHRRSVMQIVAFLIRKRPLVLQPNLPKLMEAVVKSLDPNLTANREAVLDTATEIMGYVVKTFLTVDFHMATQRLAVGSNEGATVMYDLKTAIRLYVLEGHKKRITACSFSPDGRRLVTLSLEENTVLVWKVGSSFASFFNPGAPPRQGHGGSQPFKTLHFAVESEAAHMTETEVYENVQFEWANDRSIKLKIRDNILTFST